MKLPVLDLHCDTSLKLARNETLSLRKNTLDIDLERGGTIGGYAQCFGCFTFPGMAQRGMPPQDVFKAEREALIREFERCKDVIRPARNAYEVQKNLEDGYISGLRTLEGTAGIDNDPSRLEELRKEGFCIVSLTWNEQNKLAGSHSTGGGLTDLGREFVKEAQRVGMIVDVSHISDEAFWDIMNITQAPIIATHSNSRVIHPVSRNLTDDMFKAICEVGGVAGFNQYTAFIAENATMDDSCRHILHFLELDPDGTHIALGGDLDGCETLPVGFHGVQSYPDFADKLLSYGVNEPLLRKIYWNNAFGVIKQCSL